MKNLEARVGGKRVIDRGWESAPSVSRRVAAASVKVTAIATYSGGNDCIARLEMLQDLAHLGRVRSMSVEEGWRSSVVVWVLPQPSILWDGGGQGSLGVKVLSRAPAVGFSYRPNAVTCVGQPFLKSFSGNL